MKRFTLGMKWSIVIFCVILLIDTIPVLAAVDDSNTDHLLHFDGNYNDESGGSWSNAGVSIDTSNTKIGSGALTGIQNQYIYSANNIASYNHGTSDFTIDFWIYPTTFSSATYIYEYFGDASNYERIQLNSASAPISYIFYTGGTKRAEFVSYPATLPLNAWTHVAIVRNGETCKIFFNGTSQTLSANQAFNGNLDISAALGPVARIGPRVSYSTYITKIDEIRLSHIARWTTDFTPQTYQYGSSPTDIDNDFFLVDSSSNSVIDDSGTIYATDTVLGTIISSSTNVNGLYTLPLIESQSYTVVGVVPGYLNGTISINPPLNGAWGEGPPNYPYNIFMTKANSNASRAYVNFFVTSPKYYGAIATPQQGARITINGASGTTNFAGYYRYDADKNTTYTYTVTLSGFMSRTGTFNVTADTNINIELEKIYETLTPTPFPTGTATPPGAIPTLSDSAKAGNVQKGMDVWYKNIEFIGNLLFLAFVMGVMGLIGGGFVIGGKRRRR